VNSIARTTFLAGSALALLACTHQTGAGSIVPEVQNFKQSECTGDAVNPDERMTVEAGAHGLHIEYHDAHFRCDQAVTAHVRVDGAGVSVLVQPVNLHPLTVSKCDCLYEIEFDIARLAAGSWDVTLDRRWDARHSPNEPVRVGSARVSTR